MGKFKNFIKKVKDCMFTDDLAECANKKINDDIEKRIEASSNPVIDMRYNTGLKQHELDVVNFIAKYKIEDFDIKKQLKDKYLLYLDIPDKKIRIDILYRYFGTLTTITCFNIENDNNVIGGQKFVKQFEFYVNNFKFIRDIIIEFDKNLDTENENKIIKFCEKLK